MPARFKVRIEPVDENVERVLEVVMEHLGPDSRAEAERLVEEGGGVLGDLNREAAEQVKAQLERAGAVAEIVPEEETTSEEFPDALGGRVRGIESGRPVEGAEVSIRPADPDVDETFGSATTREDGTFTLPRFGVVVREFFPESRPDLQVTVVREGQEVETHPKPFDWEAFAEGDYTYEIEAAAPPTWEDEMFSISGGVTRSDGDAASGVTVRAYDRDLRSRQLLGEATTGEGGEYEITYTRDQFRRTEKERADLVVNAFNEAGTELEVDSNRDDTIFNAEREEIVNLEVVSDELIELSEYERLVEALTPLLDGVPLADLTEDDVDFLAKDTGREEDRVRFLSRDAQLSQAHDVREAVFYGFARQDVGVVEGEDGPWIDLAAVLEQSNDALRSHLNTAISNRIIPVQVRESLDDIIDRLDALRAEQQERQREEWPEHEVTGSVLNEETDEPLPGYAVHITNVDAEPDRELGRDFTDGDGHFTFKYRTRPEEADTSRAIQFTIQSPDGEEIATRDVDVQPGQSEDITLRIQMPEAPVPGADEEVKSLSIGLPDDAVSALEESGVKTLADIRGFDDLTQITGIGEARAKGLRAHAELSLLPANGEVRQSLIDKGFGSLIDIANTPRQDFSREVGDEVEKPDRLYDASVAAKSTLDNMITTFRTNRANGFGEDYLALPDDFELSNEVLGLCDCPDCESAVSPGAYLADLTQYVVKHVKENGNKITLDRLEELFHQPFGDLPVSCEASEEEVRQVRICIEVLLRHLGKSQIQFLSKPTSKGGEYRRQAYESLLTQIGTSHEELRRAQAASDEDRQSLASRLGIAVDHLDQLLFDPSAPLRSTSGTPAVSEESLEAVFGLPAFTYYDSSTSKLTLPDPLRNLDDPDLQRWQIEHQRHQWTRQDHPADAYTREELPIIDPDVIGPDDFRAPGTSNTAFRIWKNRREWVDKRLRELRKKKKTVTVDGNSVDVPDIDVMINDVMAKKMTYNDVQGQQRIETPWKNAPTLAELHKMHRKLNESTDAETVRQKIRDEFHLSVESFTRLVELWEKDQKWSTDHRQPRVTESEWREVRSILVQAQKRSFYGWWIWKEWDLNVVLGPKRFWISLREPTQGRWSSALVERYGQSNPFIDPEQVDRDGLPGPAAGKEAIDFWKMRRRTLEEKRSVLWDTYQQSGFDAVLKNEVYTQGPPAGHSNWDAYFQNRAVDDIEDDLSLDDEESARKLKSIRAKATAGSAATDGTAPPSTEELKNVFAMLTSAWKRREKYSDWFSEETNEFVSSQGTEYWRVRKARLPQWRASRADRQQWQQALRRRSQPPTIDPDLLVPGDDLNNPKPGNAPFGLWQNRQTKLSQDLKDLRNTKPHQALVSDVKQEANRISDLKNFSKKLEERLSSYPVGRILNHPDDYSPSDLSNYLSEDTTRLHRLIDKAVGVSLKTLVHLADQEQNGSSIDARLSQLSLTRQAFNVLIEVHDRLSQGVSVQSSTWEEIYHLLVAVMKKRRYAEWQQEERPTYFFDLDPKFSDKLDAGNLTSALRTAFQNQNAALSQDVAVTTREPGSRWLLRDEGNNRIYIISTGRVQFQQATPKNTLHVYLKKGSVGGTPPRGAILLSPEQFRLADRGDMLDRFDDESPKRWRMSLEVVREWRDTLEARVEQRDQLKAALREAVSQAEEETLTVLRDALIEQLPQPSKNAPVGDKAEWTDERFVIDTKLDTCATTTRVAQAMKTLQGLVFSIRMGDDLHLPGSSSLGITDKHFETRWQWIGSYEAWRSAMSVFLYPQNVLLPTLRSEQSPAFRTLVDDLRQENKAPEKVAENYFQYVRDLFDLRVEAACPVDRENEGEELYAFARGPEQETGPPRYYWTSFDTSADLANSQEYWTELPVERLGGDAVRELIGAIQHGPFVYLFAKVWDQSSGRDELKYARLAPESSTTNWKGPYSVDLPSFDEDTFSAVVKQNISRKQPPHLAVMPENGPVYDKYVYDSEANVNWREEQQRVDDPNPIGNEWRVIDSGRYDSPTEYMENYFTSLRSMVELKPASPEERGEIYLIAGGEGQLHYRLFGEYDDGRFRVFDNQTWTDGAFLWPNTNKVYEFWDGYGKVIERKPSLEWRSTDNQTGLDVLNSWFKRTVRLDLDSVEYKAGESYYDHFSNTYDLNEVKKDLDNLFKKHPEWQAADDLLRRNRSSDVTDLADAIVESEKNMQFKVRVKQPTEDSSVSPGLGSSAGIKPGRFFTRRTLQTDGQSDHIVYVQNTDAVKIANLHSQAQRSNNRLFTSLKKEEPVKVDEISVPSSFDGETIEDWMENAEETWKTHFSQGTKALHKSMREAFYYVPMQIGLAHRKKGRYLDALNWFRLAYNYQAEKGQRKSFFLKQQKRKQDAYQPEARWLLDPIDPHEIARTRGQAYTQFTLFTIIRTLIQYGDDEFTKDTPESVSRARQLYQSALDLLDDELEQVRNRCEELTVKVKKRIQKAIEVEGTGFDGDSIGNSLARKIDQFNDTAKLIELDKALAEIDFEGEPRSERLTRVSEAADAVDEKKPSSATVGESLAQHASAEETLVRRLLANRAVARSTSRFAEEAMSLRTVPYGSRDSIYVADERTVSMSFCVPANPLLESLREHASQNLTKIRNCQNIAGMHRDLVSYAAPTDAESAVPSEPSDLPTRPPDRSRLRPTQYRYDTLINRSKELANLAQQFESQLLRLFEKRDKEAFRQLKAEQRRETAQARVNLQGQRIDKAEARVELASLQRERAQIQVGTYQQWLAAGLSRWEQQMIDSHRKASQARQAAAGLSWFSSTVKTLAMASAGGPATAATGLVRAGFNLAATGARSKAIEAQTQARIASIRASHARRKQRWRLRENLARQDVRISTQRMEVAREQIDVVREERRIAKLQADHANEISEFLANKFTSRELYEWMLEIIEEVYRTFLQQATSMAKLAERQLAFERHEAPQQMIESNYWQAPTEGRVQAGGDEESQSRHGLSGSSRLLQDIYQLDQYAFRTDERKQQVSKTISLAQLAPFELQQLRETGVLSFDTYQELFERDHPGHYLRLIKNISVSVIALTPPTDGIKAELRNSGISRVVTGGPPFRTEVIRRDPEMITLSSPQNETGIFQLKPEGEKLMPFEKTGVDTSWELRMPKPANAFDYDTIADVLLTINYTALQSDTYRQQVIKRLDPEQSGQRAFSFNDEFADPWYDLHNPAQTDDPMTVNFETRRADFPPNMTDVEIENVLLYYVTEDGVDTEDLKTTLKFMPQGGQGTVEGTATPVEQRVSTRRGNGSSWMPMIGKSVEGEWDLSLPNTAKVKRMFDEEKIEDILFVITYEGRSPEWPS